jgi:hypothetical protein
VPLKQRPVLIARDHRRTLKFEGNSAEDGGPLYSKQDSLQDAGLSPRTTLDAEITKTPGMVALHFDFVAKPEGTRELNGELGAVLKTSGMVSEGLETALLLVSDREARLVTLLTFWDARRFANARERRIAWMQKLLAPFADGPVRAQTSTPLLVLAGEAEFDIEKALTIGAAELTPMAG